MGIIKLTEKEVSYSPTRNSYFVVTMVENGQEVVRRVPVYAFEDILGSSYEQIAIQSFTSSITSAELGATITNPITLTYSFNKLPSTVTLDNESVNNFAQSGTISLTGHSISSNKTWVLVATDEKNKSATRSVSLTFMNRIYYGATTIPSTITNDFLFGLSNVLSNTKSRKITVNATGNNYIWHCSPARLGTCNFKVGGFDGGFELYTTFNHTNASGYQESYYIYKSDNSNLGNTTIEIS